MKCRALVKWVERRRKGSGEKYCRANFWMHEEQYNQAKKNFPKNYPKRDELQVCDGNVTAKLDLEMGGECSCSGYPILEIKYKCDKCGFHFYPNAPGDIYSLENFLNEKLKEMK